MRHVRSISPLLHMSSLQQITTFSYPEAAILVVSATDRDLWQGPKQEVRESWTSGFCAQSQKLETHYKNG